MAVRFETNRYEASHGRKPSGRGCWAFEWEGHVYFAPACFQTLKEAKAWMNKVVRRTHQDAIVHVAP